MSEDGNGELSREGLRPTGITPSPATVEGVGRGSKKKEELMGSPTHLTHLFGAEGRRVLIEWVFRKIEEDDFDDYSKSAITEQTGVMRNTIIKHIDTLVKYGIIEEVGSEARPRYKAPEEGQIVVALMELNAMLADERTEE